MTNDAEPSLSGVDYKNEIRTAGGTPNNVTHLTGNPPNLELLVKGPQLLEMLFAQDSRPSMQWLRAQVKAKSIPYLKRGRLLFFRPRTVLEFFAQREVKPAIMRKLQ